MVWHFICYGTSSQDLWNEHLLQGWFHHFHNQIRSKNGARRRRLLRTGLCYVLANAISQYKISNVLLLDKCMLLDWARKHIHSFTTQQVLISFKYLNILLESCRKLLSNPASAPPSSTLFRAEWKLYLVLQLECCRCRWRRWRVRWADEAPCPHKTYSSSPMPKSQNN